MPYDKKPSSVTRMYDKKGKQTGLMMEGSVAHMDHGDSAMKMSPYKMHGDDSTPHPEKKKEKKEPTLSDKDKWIDKKLNELAKTKPDMTALERLKFAQSSYAMLPK